MQLNLGQTIRALRHRDGRTQEALAEAIGVTSQAVSRWESNGGYPDMETIPSIANYFGVTIDELFGYRNDRERRVDAIVQQIDAFGIKARGDDEWVDECLALLREGLAEFPQNERLLITLADTLSEAGWRRHKEWQHYDDEGFLRHNHDIHRRNEYWAEAIKLCEQLVAHAEDPTTRTEAIRILVSLYRNIGERDLALACAQKMPSMKHCWELLLATATDGREGANYIGAFLLEAAALFAQQLVYGLVANKHHFSSDLPIEKLKGAISLFYLLCDDGNMGPYHGDLIELYLYLSRVQWERGYHDEAFASLYQSLRHARALEAVCDGQEHTLRAPLVAHVRYQAPRSGAIAASLPTDWPMWCHPDYSQVEKEIKADPRWAEWVAETQKYPHPDLPWAKPSPRHRAVSP